jgi:hypothetical protein
MIEELISKVSNNTINDFFRQKITSYRPEQEDLDHLLGDKDFDDFSDLIKLGEAAYDDSDELLVFSCQYKNELSSRNSKKKQYDIAKKVLKDEYKDAAIFIFYDENGKFRLSLIRTNYLGTKKTYSNWKRFTYFVDPAATNKTFRIRIEKCNFNSLDEIQEAFSVEPLNKEFYDKIVRAFYSLVGGEVGTGRNTETLEANLELPGGEKDRTIVRQFGTRLVGRIIFCWFLKHKTSSLGVSLIPNGWISSGSVTDNYYHSILEVLFFEILNKTFEDRPKNLPEGHELVPFLNGGLFEPQAGTDSDYYALSEPKANYQLKITDKWFNELFEVLEQYNFTIDENSVNDAEVSIDPEMLGRIFENLLAEIDPNLSSAEKKSVRKATGSFYTPREIVDYMAEEALVKYLHNRTGCSEKDLMKLFREEATIDFNVEEKMAILNAFDQVKILDPAAGSGAFPMGCLHKVVVALQKLDPGAETWKQKQLNRVTNAAIRDVLKTTLDRSNAEYARKLGVLQHCIYGTDIQPIAAEISRLRSFLSLIVEEEIQDDKPNRGIVALPNLEFKFVTANTLNSLDTSGNIETTKVSELIPKLHQIRKDYLQAHGDEKIELRKEFHKIQKEIIEDQLTFDPSPNTRPMQLASWDPFKNETTDWFDSEWMFGVKQFDIVIGNPPYGGTKISDQLKTKLTLGSKDPYGAFIAKYLRKKREETPLRGGGILAFIVSDTFMTIKTHKQLRDLILENSIHSMTRVHPDTFNATVNTAVFLCERLEKEKEQNNMVLMADFTNTSIHEQHDRFIELLDKITDYEQPEYEGEALHEDHVLYMKGEDWTSESSEEYAVYTYPEKLILANSNHPFFVSSPKLFGLMNDTTAPKDLVDINGSKVDARKINVNGNQIPVIKLEQIADVKQGLATGDNDSYLFQNPNARGNYRDINEYQKYLLLEKDLTRIKSDEKLRKAVIEKGISKDDSNSDRYFDGRYIVPYDKGGESDSGGGWMPNYYVPTNYFIDWSEWAVNRLKSYTIAERISDKNENKAIKQHYKTTNCAVIRSPDRYFMPSISFSRTGVYSPTFRIGSNAKFDTEGSMIFQDTYDYYDLIAVLSSKYSKFSLKCVLGHTVHCQVDELKELSITTDLPKTEESISKLINQQQVDGNYDYASNEQLEIDYLVFKAHGFIWEDILEVENWYARRYPKLIKAQKRNLKALGKPTSYIDNYKLLVDKYGDLN